MGVVCLVIKKADLATLAGVVAGSISGVIGVLAGLQNLLLGMYHGRSRRPKRTPTACYDFYGRQSHGCQRVTGKLAFGKEMPCSLDLPMWFIIGSDEQTTRKQTCWQRRVQGKIRSKIKLFIMR